MITPDMGSKIVRSSCVFIPDSLRMTNVANTFYLTKYSAKDYLHASLSLPQRSVAVTAKYLFAVQGRMGA